MISKHLMAAMMAVATVLAGTDARAEQFSADLVLTGADKAVPARAGRVFVAATKVRFETPTIAGGFFVIDPSLPGAWFVRPRQKLFMDARQSSQLTQLLIRVDPDDPCPRWQAMARLAGADGGGNWRCKALGAQALDGRDTLEYEMISPQSEVAHGWVDRALKFLVKLEDQDGSSTSLANIRIVDQPDNLFTIPPDYHKFDPAQLIETIKQSDVWVEPVR